MIQTVSKLYEGSSLTRTTLQLMFLRAPVSGTIKSVYIYSASNIVVGASVFNLRINGAQQWSADNRPAIGAGASVASKTGLNIAVARGNVIYLDLEQSAQSGTPAPIVLVIEIDDGISAGANNADDISVNDSTFVVIEGDDVQEAFESVDTELDALADDISAKQNALVSGTNIKTINGTSLLGPGNISISGGGGGNGFADIYSNFVSAGTLADFTRQDSNAANNTLTNIPSGGIKIDHASASGSVVITKSLPNTASWTVTAGFRCNSTGGTYWNAGLYLLDSANGKVKTFHFFPNYNQFYGGVNLNFLDSYVGDILAAQAAPELGMNRPLNFMRVSKSGTTLTFSVSYDNVLFREIGTTSSAAHTTLIDKVGFISVGVGGGNTAFSELRHFAIT